MRTFFIALFTLAIAAPAGAQVLEQPASASPAPAARLEDLVATLDRDNPELKASRREIDMAVARVRPAGALPDPTLSAGYMSGFLRPPFSPSSATPDGFRQFGVTQEIPYPGKLALRTRIAIADTDVTRWQYEGIRVDLIAELKTMYLEYRLADRSLAIVRRNKTLLEDIQRIAEARFSVGQGAQQDVLKAQLEVSMLLERITMLQRDKVALQARINGLLYREPGTPVDPALAYDPAPLPGDVTELRRLAEQRYPALRRAERQIARSEQAVALARKEVLPDLGFNVTTQKPASGMPWMYGVDVMVKVPIFWERKQRPMIAEAAAGLESSRRMRDNTRAIAVATLDEQYAAAAASQRLLALYSQSLLPQARLTFESAQTAYQVGRVDFLSLLTTFTTILNYELGYEQQTAQLHRALARLEPLTGLALLQ